MTKFIDRSGLAYGMLTAVSVNESRSKPGKIYWNCLCDCGEETVVYSSNLGKSVKSCGCHRRKNMRSISESHGLSKSSEYKIWILIKSRCNNPNNVAYKNYGGRGISVCEKWGNDFLQFLNDVGNRPSKHHEIDRIDNNLDYQPGNCRWVKRVINCQNRRSSKYWFINGVRYESISQAALNESVSEKTIKNWCDGYSSRGNHYPPKLNCYSERKY